MTKSKRTKEVFDEQTGEIINMETGEINPETVHGKLNEVIYIRSVRPNGRLRIQQDFKNCPTLTEQHTAHLTNLNYLIERYKPDELAAYITARSQYRREILGHDFSQEPSLQEAKNIIYESKQAFQMLSDELKMQFKNHVEFLKFIDNPENVEKLIRTGMVTKKEIDKVKIPDTDTAALTTPTKHEEKKD